MPSKLALTPPMGWDSWNKFGHDIEEGVVCKIADAMVSTGMRAAGYQYVNIDDGWQDEIAVDANGRPRHSPQRFPSGIKSIADYLHGKGLKLGLFCRPLWFKGHEKTAAETLAGWGVDLVKYDFSDTAVKEANRAMCDALRQTGRDIVFGVCEWGVHKPWEWAAEIGAQYWRTTFDLYDAWDADRNTNAGVGIMLAVDFTEPLAKYAGPGHWNDLDMLVVGLKGDNNTGGSGCTDDEYRAQFSLWCLLASPLIAGNDLTKMDAATREILTNVEAIAINQDALGAPARRVSPKDNVTFEHPNGPRRLKSPLEVWKKPLENGELAVGLLNRFAASATITAAWSDLEISGIYTARDLWAHKDLGKFQDKISLEVPSHGLKLLRLSAKK
jgi:alpha-galactosidase